MTSNESWVPLAPLARCGECPLYVPLRPRGHPCVPGSGMAESDLVFVGMSPGRTEIAVRKPFVGDAGNVLAKACRAHGLVRTQLYMTNAALCAYRVSNENMPPPAVALKACQVRLFEEIRLRQPKVVVLLGNTALSSFGIAERIGACRGRERWLTVNDLRAALLHGRSKTEIASDPVLRRWASGYEETYLPKLRRGVEAQPPMAGGLPPVDDWRDGGVYVLPTYHPAAALRTPDYYTDIVKDVGRAVALLQRGPAETRTLPTVQMIVPESVAEALRWIERISQQPSPALVACDIESRSKDMLMRDDALLTLAYAWREQDTIYALVLPAYRGRLEDVHESWQSVSRCALSFNPLVRTKLRQLHDDPSMQFCWWNGKFDRKWIQRYLGFTVRIDSDGMLLSYSLDTRPGIHGLKNRSSDDLGAGDYEQVIRSYTGKGDDVDYGRIPFDKLAYYTGLDVGMTLQLVERYEAELAQSPKAKWAYNHILLPGSECLADIELAGAPVNVAKLHELDEEYTGPTGILTRARQELEDVLGAPVNASSTPQLVQALYGDEVRAAYDVVGQTANGLPTLGLPVQLGEKSRPTTSADACDKLLQMGLTDDQRRFVTALRRLRLDGQLYIMYIKKLPKAVGPDGRIRTNFNLHTTRTGRLSSSDPTNLQNIPARRQEGQRIRAAFEASEWDGRPTMLAEVDISQCEFRVAAFLSRDPGLMQIYLDGRDFHHEVGVAILSSEERARELRPYIKTANFARLYGGEAGMMAILLNDTTAEEEARIRAETGQSVQLKRWTFKEAEDMNAAFWAQFPAFAAWARLQRRQALDLGWLESYFGRRRWWRLVTPNNRRDVEKEAVNHPIQSTAADIVTLAMIELHRLLCRRFPGLARIIATVHDSLVLEIVQGYEQEVLKLAVEVLEGLPAQHGIDLPFVADAKVGPNWRDLKRMEL